MSDEDYLHRYISDYDIDDPVIASIDDPKEKKRYFRENIDPNLLDHVIDYWSDDEGRYIKIRNPKTGSVFKLERSKEDKITQQWLDFLERPPKYIFKYRDWLNTLSKIELNEQPYLPHDMLEGLANINLTHKRAIDEVERKTREDIEDLFLKSRFNIP